MSPQNLVRLGPFTLRADDDADVIRALEASGNKVGLVRACIRLAMAAGEGNLTTDVVAALTPEEWALIERAREAK